MQSGLLSRCLTPRVRRGKCAAAACLSRAELSSRAGVGSAGKGLLLEEYKGGVVEELGEGGLGAEVGEGDGAGVLDVGRFLPLLHHRHHLPACAASDMVARTQMAPHA